MESWFWNNVPDSCALFTLCDVINENQKLPQTVRFIPRHYSCISNCAETWNLISFLNWMNTLSFACSCYEPISSGQWEPLQFVIYSDYISCTRKKRTGTHAELNLISEWILACFYFHVASWVEIAQPIKWQSSCWKTDFYMWFLNTVNVSEYITWNGRMTGKQWIGKDMEGSHHCLIEVVPRHTHVWAEWGEPTKPCQDSRCPSRDSNPAPFEYKSSVTAWANLLGDQALIPRGCKDFFLCHHVQTSSRFHPASFYSVEQ
jgi:hypothetical protein